MKDALQSIAPCTEEDYVSRPFSDVQDEEITWLFQDRIAFGMVSIVVGYPGAGKSSMLIDLMSRASTTGEMPDGTVLPGPINCIYLCTEAGKRSAIKGMLKKANADTDRVFYIEENYLTLSDAKIRKAVHERKAKRFEGKQHIHQRINRIHQNSPSLPAPDPKMESNSGDRKTCSAEP